MKYKLYLILFIILAAIPVSSTAQQAGYRIEIIVLTHLEHDAQPKKLESLRDFSDSLDLLTVADEEDSKTDSQIQEAVKTSGQDDVFPSDSAEFGLDLDEDQDPWAQVVRIEDMGEVMQDAWRRLRLSAPFRPQQYLSWVQSADEPFPLLRLHNMEVILIEDPGAERRIEFSGAESGYSDSTAQPNVFSDQDGALPGDPLEEPEVPALIRFHEIDGTVMLKRTRFLHLDLDLEMREELFEEGMTPEPPVTREGTTEEMRELPRPSAFLVHSLNQSRQVKSERMEYFDGPVLSVLAYISAAELEEPLDSPPQAMGDTDP